MLDLAIQSFDVKRTGQFVTTSEVFFHVGGSEAMPVLPHALGHVHVDAVIVVGHVLVTGDVIHEGAVFEAEHAHVAQRFSAAHDMAHYLLMQSEGRSVRLR